MRSTATTSLSRNRPLAPDTRLSSGVGGSAGARRASAAASTRHRTRPGQRLEATALSKRAVRGAYKLSRPARPYLPSLGITTEMDGMLSAVQGVA
jgi:hypothetical protein